MGKKKRGEGAGSLTGLSKRRLQAAREVLDAPTFRRWRTRIEMHLTARQIAEEIGVPLGTFWCYEGGFRPYDDEVAQKWDKALRKHAQKVSRAAARAAK